MASLQNSLFLIKFMILYCFVFLSDKIHASTEPNDFHTIHVSSLFPDDSVCEPSTGSRKGSSTIEVFDRYGPCSNSIHGRTATTPPLSEILSRDESRVRSIQAKLSRDSGVNKFQDMKVNLPAQLGVGNYFVKIGLGSPEKTLSLNFDTGSDLTWTQCQPCGRCYPQDDPIFDPSSSTSYSNISCDSLQCDELASANHNDSPCSGGKCTYRLAYGDQSTSTGPFSKDTLTLTPTDIVPDFLFGCGQDNTGLFFQTAGLLGLGRGTLSIVSQTAQKYGKYFSYCLPSTRSSSGYLTLGKTGSSSGVIFTPFAGSRGTSFYFIDIVGISVKGQELPIDKTVFTTGGNIIDSGTVVTRLPPTAYSAVSKAFQEGMASYPRAPATELLDTCYDFSNFTEITIPKIGFTFAGNVRVDLGFFQVMSVHSIKQVCLAFAANQNDGELGIFGNIQQRTLEVVYDVAGGNIGFGAGGCK